METSAISQTVASAVDWTTVTSTAVGTFVGAIVASGAALFAVAKTYRDRTALFVSKTSVHSDSSFEPWRSIQVEIGNSGTKVAKNVYVTFDSDVDQPSRVITPMLSPGQTF